MTSTITPEYVESRVVEAIASFGPEPDQVTRDASLAELEIDSLDLVELTQIVDDELGVELTANDIKDVATVGDAIDVVLARVA